MKNSKLLSLATASALAISLAFTGCGSNETSSTDSSVTKSVEGLFTYALSSDIVSLDPAYSYDLVTNPVVNQITESLLVLDDDGLLQPLLCSSWEATDEVTYIYQIRDDITFSDGSNMTIDDVIYSLERYMDPEVASYIAWMYDSVESIEQSGDWEITIHLSAPDALWQYTLATSAGHIVSKSYCEEVGDSFGNPTGGTMGTGPYIFDSWNTGSQITLVKNENYWDLDVLAAMEVDTIIYPIIIEDTTRVQAMINGEVDFTMDPPMDMMEELSSADNLIIESFETFNIDFLAFNTEVAPFDDVNVRRAIASLCDKETITNVVFKDYAQVGTALPMGQALFTAERDSWEAYVAASSDYPYDFDAAYDYLAASDYPNGFEATLLVNETSAYNSIALMLQNACSEIGITLNIEKVTNDELINMQFGSSLNADGTKAFEMGLFTWISDFPDISGNIFPLFLSDYKESGGSNTTGYTNTTVDELLVAQAQSLDTAERSELLQEVSDYLYDEIPQVNLVYADTISICGSRIVPFEVSPAYIWNLYVKNIKLQ